MSAPRRTGSRFSEQIKPSILFPFSVAAVNPLVMESIGPRFRVNKKWPSFSSLKRILMLEIMNNQKCRALRLQPPLGTTLSNWRCPTEQLLKVNSKITTCSWPAPRTKKTFSWLEISPQIWCTWTSSLHLFRVKITQGKTWINESSKIREERSSYNNNSKCNNRCNRISLRPSVVPLILPRLEILISAT